MIVFVKRKSRHEFGGKVCVQAVQLQLAKSQVNVQFLKGGFDMTYTINDSNSIFLVVDDEGEADTNSTTARRAVIMQDGKTVPTNFIFPGAMSIIIMEYLVLGTFQVEIEYIDGTFLPLDYLSFDSLDAVATHIASEMSQILPTIRIFDDHTRMVMLKNPLSSKISWRAFFIQDGKCIPTSFILPGIEGVFVSKCGPIYVIDMIYSDESCDRYPDGYESLDEATNYIADLAVGELLKKIFWEMYFQV